jgi:hypothetical protein
MKILCGKAAEAAQSWKNDAEKEAIAERKTALSIAASARGLLAPQLACG